MATVYKAKCHVLKRFVAVKILRDEFTTDEEFIKRFNIEAQAVASLTHPNIVSVYDVGSEGNLYYIVMELVQGKTLKEIIVEDGILGWKWSLKIALQISSALETAHRNNIVHRDIKPHNIIITEEGIAKVTDFGIAKAVSNSTITAFGTTIGSVHYFSPEHARGGFTDEKSDLYSVGVVLYEMVTGRVPFDSDTPVSVALKHMQEDAVEPKILNPDVPMSVNNIIVKAMQKDPINRYSSATEMIRDLNLVLKNPDSNFVAKNLDNTAATQRIDLSKEKDVGVDVPGDPKDKNVKRRKKSKLGEFFEKHKAVKVIIMILIAIVVFALSMFGTFLALNAGKVKEVVLPNVVGKTLEEAKTEAENNKLKIEVVEEKYHLEVPEGQIIEQDPKFQNNFKVKEGSAIKIVVSKGQEIVPVPNVLGKPKGEAMQELKNAGLEIHIVEEHNDEIAKGSVIKQDIAGNEQIPAGTTVTITVSLGIEQVQVPDLLNRTESEAKKLITDNKLVHKATIKTNDSSKPNGVVVDQSITGLVDKNSEVTITINEFNELKSATVTINVKSITGYTPPSNTGATNTVEKPTEKVTLRLTVNDEPIGTRTVEKSSTKEVFTFQDTGTVDIKVFIDDNRVSTQRLNLNEKTSLTID